MSYKSSIGSKCFWQGWAPCVSTILLNKPFISNDRWDLNFTDACPFFDIKDITCTVSKFTISACIKCHSDITFWGRSIWIICPINDLIHYDNFDCRSRRCTIWEGHCYWDIKFTSCGTIWQFSWIIHCDRWLWSLICWVTCDYGSDHFISRGWIAKGFIDGSTFNNILNIVFDLVLSHIISCIRNSLC